MNSMQARVLQVLTKPTQTKSKQSWYVNVRYQLTDTIGSGEVVLPFLTERHANTVKVGYIFNL
jgi:hypothetical protein